MKKERSLELHIFASLSLLVWMETQEIGDTDCFEGGEAGGWGWRGGVGEYSLFFMFSFVF